MPGVRIMNKDQRVFPPHFLWSLSASSMRKALLTRFADSGDGAARRGAADVVRMGPAWAGQPCHPLSGCACETGKPSLQRELPSGVPQPPFAL